MTFDLGLYQAISIFSGQQHTPIDFQAGAPPYKATVLPDFILKIGIITPGKICFIPKYGHIIVYTSITISSFQPNQALFVNS